MVSLALRIGNVWQTVNVEVATALPKRLIVQRASRGLAHCQCGLSTGATGS